MSSPGVLNLTFIWKTDAQELAPFQWHAPVRDDEYTLPLEFWQDTEGTIPYVIEGPCIAQVRLANFEGAEAGEPVVEFTVTQLAENELTLILERPKTLILPSVSWYWDLQDDATTLVGGKGKTNNDVSRVAVV